MSTTVLTLSQIKTKLSDYLESLDIVQTTVIDSLLNLLSYSIYVDEVSRLSLLTQVSLPLSTSINSKIFHASNYLYSVYRGELPKIVFPNTVCRYNNKTIKKLDLDTLYNGYYFYYNSDYEITSASEAVDVSLIISKYKLQEVTVQTSDSEVYIDLLDCSDMSEDIWLFDSNGDELTFTEDPYKFFSTTDYDYLVTTIKNYGIRILRNIGLEDTSIDNDEESRTTPWSTNSITVKYFKYSSTIPGTEILNNITLSNFSKSTNTDDSYRYTNLKSRDENLTLLTNDIIRYQSSRDIICTRNHLKSFINDLISRNIYDKSSNPDGTTTNSTFYYINDNKETNETEIFLVDPTFDMTSFKSILQEALDTMSRSIRLQLIKFIVKIAESNDYKLTTYSIKTEGRLTQDVLTNLADRYNKEYINKDLYIANLIYDITQQISADVTIRVYKISKDESTGEEISIEQLSSNLIDISIKSEEDIETGSIKVIYNYIKLQLSTDK